MVAVNVLIQAEIIESSQTLFKLNINYESLVYSCIEDFINNVSIDTACKPLMSGNNEERHLTS